jgi:hypothetical protein
MSILMPTSSPRLIRLLCLCRCHLLLCYTLVLFPLFFGVDFKLSLISFWGCLKLILCAFDCFIGTFEPSMTRLDMLFTYLLTKLFEI